MRLDAARATRPSPRVLREYALVADGERGAVIGPDGSRRLAVRRPLGQPGRVQRAARRAGRYTVDPADPWHVWGGYYENGSLIWRSRWVGDRQIECREALAMPADPHRAVLLRRIEAIDGPAKVNVSLDLRARYGRGRMTDMKRQGETWTGRSGGTWFRWSGAGAARHADGALADEVELAEGAKHDLVLEISDREFTGEPPDAGLLLGGHPGSLVAGRSRLRGPDRGLRRAARLRGAARADLGERRHGGGRHHVAARAAGGRAQLRLPLRVDQGPVLRGLAVAAHGPHPLLAGAVRFVAERLLADGPGLMPAYTVAGEPIGDEVALRLRGFPGGSARAGNRVRGQFQLDAVGESLSLFAAAARHDMLSTDDWRAAAVAADVIEKRWREPDAGIWELDDKRWTHSRLACVSGLRAIAVAAAAGPPGGTGQREAARWSSLADAITASLSDAVHPCGRWQRAPDDERVDAALLLSCRPGRVPRR